MLERFNGRTENLKSVIATLRRQVGSANAELSSMRGNSVWLRGEIAERQARIDALTARLAELETPQDDNIIQLPRQSAATLDPRVEDLWDEDEHPTMVDLATLQLHDFEDTRLQA